MHQRLGDQTNALMHPTRRYLLEGKGIRIRILPRLPRLRAAPPQPRHGTFYKKKAPPAADREGQGIERRGGVYLYCSTAASPVQCRAEWRR
jgi:hypothetical protein